MIFYDIISVRESVIHQQKIETARNGLLPDHLETVSMTFIFQLNPT